MQAGGGGEEGEEKGHKLSSFILATGSTGKDEMTISHHVIGSGVKCMCTVWVMRGRRELYPSYIFFLQSCDIC